MKYNKAMVKKRLKKLKDLKILGNYYFEGSLQGLG